VTIGEGSYVGQGVVVESSGAPIILGREVVVFSGTVIRSVGGEARRSFPVRIGDRTVIGPLSALAGCTIGSRCYVATGVMVLQGATVGDGTRLGAGSIVHLGAVLPPGSRVGLRHLAVPAEDGGVLVTSDLDKARKAIADADFFGTVFGEEASEQNRLHDQVLARLLEEVGSWADEPLGTDSVRPEDREEEP
jgi:carbonic anhydrase/acetyltransferase-like protein (isoleucine patch superfamily)